MYKTVDTIVTRTVASVGDRLVDLNGYLSEELNLGSTEPLACVYLKQLLLDIGFKINKGIDHPNGFVASYGNGHPHVAFMCYFGSSNPKDCSVNRNLVATCAIGAGTAVREVIRMLKWRGKISLVVVPLPTSCHLHSTSNLSKFFISVDAALMVDPSGGTRNILRIAVNAYKSLAIKFTANSKTRGANSFHSRSPMDAAVFVYSKMAAMRFRERSNCFITGTITKGGSRGNLQPNETELYFSLRAPNTAKVCDLEDHLLTVVREAEFECDCSANVTVEAENHEIRNSKALSQVYSDIAATRGVFFETEALSRSEYDVCAIPYPVPSVVAVYHLNCTSHHDGQTNKDSSNSIPQSIKQMEILALTAIQVFTDRELRLTMTKEMESVRSSKSIASLGDRRSSTTTDDFSLDSWIFQT